MSGGWANRSSRPQRSILMHMQIHTLLNPVSFVAKTLTPQLVRATHTSKLMGLLSCGVCVCVSTQFITAKLIKAQFDQGCMYWKILTLQSFNNYIFRHIIIFCQNTRDFRWQEVRIFPKTLYKEKFKKPCLLCVTLSFNWPKVINSSSYCWSKFYLTLH